MLRPHVPQISAGQNLLLERLGTRNHSRMWPELYEPWPLPIITVTKFSFCCCWRNISCSLGRRGNNRIKATSSAGRSETRALGSRCTRREGGKKMLWLWQLLFSICTIYRWGRAGDRPLLEHRAQQHTNMNAEWFSDPPLPFPLYWHSHLCKWGHSGCNTRM